MITSCPLSIKTFDLDAPPMLLYDAMANGQAESGTFAYILGSKEGFKDAFAHFFGNASACVTDSDFDFIGEGKCDQMNQTSLRHGLNGIGDEVHEDLIQFAGIAFDLRDFAIVLEQIDVVQTIFQQREGRIQPIVEVKSLPVAIIQSGKGTETPDDFGGTTCPFIYAFEQFFDFFVT